MFCRNMLFVMFGCLWCLKFAKLRVGFLGKAKGYKKHGAIAVLFVFVEMVCLSAYRGRFYGREGVYVLLVDLFFEILRG